LVARVASRREYAPSQIRGDAWAPPIILGLDQTGDRFSKVSGGRIGAKSPAAARIVIKAKNPHAPAATRVIEG
jgi:hypothetical protein